MSKDPVLGALKVESCSSCDCSSCVMVSEMSGYFIKTEVKTSARVRTNSNTTYATGRSRMMKGINNGNFNEKDDRVLTCDSGS